MKSSLKHQTFLRISATRVAVVGAVATGAAFGFAACGDSDDVDPAPVDTTTVTSTEELDDDRDDRDDCDDCDDDDRDDGHDDRVNN
ncbi:hypothetical protein [Corynebacterium sp. HMSC064E07]|uniref:hypothetical protein n=1 Tax=Corynebacterium sp. HMSC064E07 TaxID=1739545 RepID=UPI00114D30E8|nr:hypothetical protein [Corynebacterium sp. HMSC064E07]